MTAERSARFTMSAHYDVRGPRWTGRVAWAEHSLSPDWGEQTLADTQARYPRADMTPYR